MTKPTQPKRRWLPDDVTRMVHMRETKKMKWSEIDAALGRPAGGSASKYESLRTGDAPHGKPNESGGRIELSQKQEADRRARKEAENHMTPTAAFFGDPPPGFSALDRRNSGARS